MSPFLSRLKNQETRKIGLLAGQGKLPVQIVEACEKSQLPYFILAFEGHTDESLVCQRPHAWIQIAKIGKALTTLKEEKVTDLLLAGRLQRPAWHELRPDTTGAKWLTNLICQVGRASGDDALLKWVVGQLEKEGFQVISSEDILGERLLLKPGVLVGPCPDLRVLDDIRRGARILRALPDVGQSVILQQGFVLGIEAIEGTDRLIERCKAYQKPGPRGVLVKMLKLDQETRVDRPTVGLQTFQTAFECGLKGIAAQAGEVILLNPKECLEYAQQRGMFLLGVNAEGEV